MTFNPTPRPYRYRVVGRADPVWGERIWANVRAATQAELAAQIRARGIEIVERITELGPVKKAWTKGAVCAK